MSCWCTKACRPNHPSQSRHRKRSDHRYPPRLQNRSGLQRSSRRPSRPSQPRRRQRPDLRSPASLQNRPSRRCLSRHRSRLHCPSQSRRRSRWPLRCPSRRRSGHHPMRSIRHCCLYQMKTMYIQPYQESPARRPQRERAGTSRSEVKHGPAGHSTGTSGGGGRQEECVTSTARCPALSGEPISRPRVTSLHE